MKAELAKEDRKGDEVSSGMPMLTSLSELVASY